ncbi:MAG: hypothetical protein IT203_03540 [Fimbriimonadaceae bacterium]|nr:hypothetical protein [Fimbriimonadaceae bacterium]
MNTAFPLIALAVAIVSLALSSPSTVRPTRSGFPAPVLLVLIALASGWYWRADYANLLPCAIAFGVGIALMGICRILEGLRSGWAAAPGLAAAIAGFAGWLDPSYQFEAQLALIAGLAIGAWSITDSVRKVGLPVGTALLASLFIATDLMGKKGLASDAGAISGTMLGLALAVSALLANVANKGGDREKESLGAMASLVAIGVLVILGYVVGARLVESQAAWLIFGGSILAGGVLNWVVRPDGRDDTLSFLFGGIIWIGIATLAFSYLKGFGIAIAAIGAVGTLMILGNPRALLSTGPLLGLAFYRVLREAHPEATRALDIGQHYAVIGIAIGMVSALLPSEWLATRSESVARFGLGRVLWALTIGLIPIAMAVVLGAKGIVGFVVGLGFAALVEGLRNGSNLLPLLMTGGMAALVATSYGWLENLLDMTRESKQAAFYWMAGVGAVLAILIAMVSKPEGTSESQ